MAQAQTKFYIIRQDTDESYEFSSTSNIKMSEPVIATKNRVETGKALTDNVYNDCKTANFSGIITNVTNSSSLTDTDKFLSEISDLRTLRPPVLVDVYAENRVLTDCVIVTFEYQKTKNEGAGAWTVEMGFQQVAFAERARLVEVAEPREEQKPDVDKTRQRSNNSVQDVEVTTTLTRSTLDLVSIGDNIPEIPSTIGDTPDGS